MQKIGAVLLKSESCIGGRSSPMFTNKLRSPLIILIYFLLVLSIIFLLVNDLWKFNDSRTPVSQTAPDFKVLFLAAGPIADQSWDAKGFEGYLNVKKTYHVEGNYVENLKPQDIQNTAMNYIQKGYTLIIGNGSEFGAPFANIAPHYPNVEFVALGGGVNGISNMVCPYFQSYPMGYFAGILAALQTKTNTLGLILPHNNMNEQKGFEDAVKKYNPSAIVKEGIVNGWNDKDKALEIAQSFIDLNVDIVFPLGDSYNFPVIHKLSQKHIYTLGYIDEQSFISKETVLVSLLQNNDKIITDIVSKWVQGKHPQGKIPYTYKDGAESLSDFSQDVPPRIQQEVTQAVNDYMSGKLAIPNSVFD